MWLNEKVDKIPQGAYRGNGLGNRDFGAKEYLNNFQTIIIELKLIYENIINKIL